MFDVFASDEVIFYTLHIKEQLAGRNYRAQEKHELPQHFKNTCYSMSADYFYPCLIRKGSLLLPLGSISRSSTLWKTSLRCQVKDIAEGNWQTLNNAHCLASYLEMLLHLCHLPAFLLWTKINVTRQEEMVSIQPHVYASKVTEKGFPEELLFINRNDELQQGVRQNTTLTKSSLARLYERTSRYVTRQ